MKRRMDGKTVVIVDSEQFASVASARDSLDSGVVPVAVVPLAAGGRVKRVRRFSVTGHSLAFANGPIPASNALMNYTLTVLTQDGRVGIVTADDAYIQPLAGERQWNRSQSIVGIFSLPTGKHLTQNTPTFLEGVNRRLSLEVGVPCEFRLAEGKLGFLEFKSDQPMVFEPVSADAPGTSWAPMLGLPRSGPWDYSTAGQWAVLPHPFNTGHIPEYIEFEISLGNTTLSDTVKYGQDGQDQNGVKPEFISFRLPVANAQGVSQWARQSREPLCALTFDSPTDLSEVTVRNVTPNWANVPPFSTRWTLEIELERDA